MKSVRFGVAICLCVLVLPTGVCGEESTPSLSPSEIKKLVKSLSDESTRDEAAEKLKACGRAALPHLRPASKRKTAAGKRAKELWMAIAGYDPAAFRKWAKPRRGAKMDKVFDLPNQVVHTTTGIELVLIRPGEFTMGASVGDNEAEAKDEPVRKVTVKKPFYVGKYEVTQKEWGRVMPANPSQIRVADRYPVNSVSWDDIQPFLKAAGLRLPTEAEWEYACRAGTKGARYGELNDIAWWGKNSEERETPQLVALSVPQRVGLKKPNAFGCYDMIGNMWEWCSDSVGQRDGVAFHVIRGGGHLNQGTFYLRASARPSVPATRKATDVGLRVAHDP
jgi:formylglycine-generating enzyme required for sulfatase activity